MANGNILNALIGRRSHLSLAEIKAVIRENIDAESDAASSYELVNDLLLFNASNTVDQNKIYEEVKLVFGHIAQEEKQHLLMLIKLLEKLDPLFVENTKDVMNIASGNFNKVNTDVQELTEEQET